MNTHKGYGYHKAHAPQRVRVYGWDWLAILAAVLMGLIVAAVSAMGQETPPSPQRKVFESESITNITNRDASRKFHPKAHTGRFATVCPECNVPVVIKAETVTTNGSRAVPGGSEMELTVTGKCGRCGNGITLNAERMVKGRPHGVEVQEAAEDEGLRIEEQGAKGKQGERKVRGPKDRSSAEARMKKRNPVSADLRAAATGK